MSLRQTNFYKIQNWLVIQVWHIMIEAFLDIKYWWRLTRIKYPAKYLEFVLFFFHQESKPIDEREHVEIRREEFHLQLQVCVLTMYFLIFCSREILYLFKMKFLFCVSLKPIVHLSTNDDDPELRYDDITVKEEPSGELPDPSQPVGETPFQCSECYFTCFQQATYLKHMESHLEDKTHVCLTCNKSFFFKNSYLRHMNVHKHEEIYIALVRIWKVFCPFYVLQELIIKLVRPHSSLQTLE